MKAVILAGGLGTRLSEETQIKPKPMVEVGGMPILWHIMKIYSHHGINDFVICAGYRQEMIKDYFANYHGMKSDITFDLKENHIEIQNSSCEPWRVTVVDTGADVLTGGRIKRVKPYIGNETFCLTYGDGVGDIDITALIAFHRAQKKLVTLTAVQPSGRFGALDLDGEIVKSFVEKPVGKSWINGGFFVVEPVAIDYIEGDHTSWEREPLEKVARDGQLAAFRHTGFWQCMDTLRDKIKLEELWESKKVPWKVWKN